MNKRTVFNLNSNFNILLINFQMQMIYQDEIADKVQASFVQ